MNKYTQTLRWLIVFVTYFVIGAGAWMLVTIPLSLYYYPIHEWNAFGIGICFTGLFIITAAFINAALHFKNFYTPADEQLHSSAERAVQ